MSWPKPDIKEFPLSDREKVIWYMFTFYLPPGGQYHRDDDVFALFRKQQCPEMSTDEFFKVVRDLQTMERNYLNKGKAMTAAQKIDASLRRFCPKCELVTIRREDGTCMMCGEKS